MMVSDELIKALKKQRANIKAGYALDFVDSVARAIPRIIALERCRKLLERHQFASHPYPSSTDYCSACHEPEQNESGPAGHDHDCEIAIALEATP